jgi:hypothetical protein
MTAKEHGHGWWQQTIYEVLLFCMNTVLNAGSFSCGTGVHSWSLILYICENDLSLEKFVIITLKSNSNITSVLGKANQILSWR